MDLIGCVLVVILTIYKWIPTLMLYKMGLQHPMMILGALLVIYYPSNEYPSGCYWSLFTNGMIIWTLIHSIAWIAGDTLDGRILLIVNLMLLVSESSIGMAIKSGYQAKPQDQKAAGITALNARLGCDSE